MIINSAVFGLVEASASEAGNYIIETSQLLLAVEVDTVTAVVQIMFKSNYHETTSKTETAESIVHPRSIDLFVWVASTSH